MKEAVSCGPNVTQTLFTLRNITPGRGVAQAEQLQARADKPIAIRASALLSLILKCKLPLLIVILKSIFIALECDSQKHIFIA